MNPDKTIREWLLVAGKQYGIIEAHDYRWADADTRQQSIYCTYQVMSSVQFHDGVLDDSSITGYTANRVAVQKWISTVQIDIHRSQDGMYELASLAVAAQGNPEIRALFDDQCALIDVLSISNMSTADGEEITYHMRMLCRFEHDVIFELSEENAVVDDVDLTLGTFT